jgi:hypothetical protein
MMTYQTASASRDARPTARCGNGAARVGSAEAGQVDIRVAAANAEAPVLRR